MKKFLRSVKTIIKVFLIAIVLGSASAVVAGVFTLVFKWIAHLVAN